jgi:hypothetical protein
MAISGDLSTMSLPDLLQWAGMNRKTGTLELTRNNYSRRIVFEAGRIVACSSDYPPFLLGQFLIARGKITRDQLREALERQEQTGRYLGECLGEMDLVGPEEIQSLLAAKARESIYGVFEWDDATFRFDEKVSTGHHTTAVDLGVEDVLLEGVHRRDELQRIRGVFRSSGVVLERTGKQIPRGVRNHPLAGRLVDLVDGERSLAEVLLHTHASEYRVIHFLFTLCDLEVLRIKAERLQRSHVPTLLDTPPEDARAAGEPSDSRAAGGSLKSGIESALQILNACYGANPGESYLRELIEETETAYLELERQRGLHPTKIPVVKEAQPGHTIQPTEQFLLGLIDGETDIKSLLWLAPMREVNVIITLRHLIDGGRIELRDASAAAGVEPSDLALTDW